MNITKEYLALIDFEYRHHLFLLLYLKFKLKIH